MNNIIETIAIGDELLIGKIADTNSRYVARELFDTFGVRLNRISTVIDDEDLIIQIILERAATAKAIICFGGLGPTSDDKTADASAKLLGCGITEHLPTREKIIQYFKDRARPLNQASLEQALYPAKAIPIPNSVGSAVGFFFKVKETIVFCLPGVPREMEGMFQQTVKPEIAKHLSLSNDGGIASHTWRCLGVWESQLQELMNPIEAILPKDVAWLGYRTTYPENHLTLYSRDHSENFENWKKKITPLLEQYTYSQNNQSLEEIVSETLSDLKLTVSLAESCTGGLVVHRLTTIPQSSAVVWGGITSYQLESKSKIFGLSKEEIGDGVSGLCTARLADSVKRMSGSDVAAAITGFMGPNGGNERNPLGTIYVCVLGPKKIEKRIVLVPRSRSEMQWGASTYLLDAIRRSLI